MNQAESDQMAADMASSSWQPADKTQDADVCIINTCTVTGKASMQSRQAIRRAMRKYPHARILVTGCYAETDPETVSEIAGNEAVIKQADQHRITTLLSGTDHPSECESNAWAAADTLSAGIHKNPFASHRTRPFLKIQDGCNAFCTYCIVPHARGRSCSLPADEVMENLLLLADAGFHEAVLAGIHLGYWGRDLAPAQTLFDLLERIDRSGPIERLRLSSIEPLELSVDIIGLTAQSSSICPHFHIPLQSGDNQVLERMGRPYTAEQFTKLVLNINRLMPDAAIGADVLVGFPGETELAFEKTRRLLESLPLSYLHVFPFSARPGTPAAKMPDQIPPVVLKDRSSRIRKIGADLRSAFYGRYHNRTLEVLVETTPDKSTGLQKGLTANYLPVLVDVDDSCQNTFIDVTITEISETHLIGVLV